MFDSAPVVPFPSFSVPAGAPRLDTVLAGPILTFTAGEEIFAEGDRSGALFQVAFGMVRVYRLLADGRRQICAFHAQGEVFGFDTGDERHFFADAVTEAGLRAIRPGSELELTHQLFKLALQSLTRAHDHLLTVGRNDAAGRVAAFLLDMAERQDARTTGAINLPMSRSDIGDFLGLTIETVSRVITRLKESGIIRAPSARHLEIRDWDRLYDLTA